jgi:hypothetical protein
VRVGYLGQTDRNGMLHELSGFVTVEIMMGLVLWVGQASEGGRGGWVGWGEEGGVRQG